MKKIKRLFAHKIFKILKWAFLILLGLYIILVIARVFHFFNTDKNNAAIEKIHSMKVTMADVKGDNLPPNPGIYADKTVQGVDANHNGIRDDVELAIFKAYPNSAKTRAALLQYAMTLQMETEFPHINEQIATTLAEKQSQAYDCTGKTVPMGDYDMDKIMALLNFVKSKQLNTTARKDLKTKFDNETRSFELQYGCDVNLDLLKN